LEDYLNTKYDIKIEALDNMGMQIPAMIKNFVIKPRNIEEHKYTLPTARGAADAKETAVMFIGYLKSKWELRLGSKLVFATSVHEMDCFRDLFNRDIDEELKFEGVLPSNFIFIDTFAKPAVFKLVNTSDRSGLIVRRKNFAIDELRRFDELSSPRDTTRKGGGIVLCGGWSTTGNKSAIEIAKYMHQKALI